MSRGTSVEARQRPGASASLPGVAATHCAPGTALSRPPASARTQVQSTPSGPAGKLSIVALACLGLLAGPFAVAAMLGLPLAVIVLGVWQDDLVVQLVGGVVLVVHGFAAWSLTRADQAGRQDDAAISVSDADAPELHKLINVLRQRVGAAKITRVVLSTDLNASVSQTPVLFGLAGHRNELSIGLPLLQALNRDEFAAVIAHELAHLRRDDGKIHALVFRVREQWERLDRAAQSGEFLGRSLLRRFARWYRPRFERCSADVLREGEFAADSVAAAVAGPNATARALTRAAIAQARLIDLWSMYWLQNVRIAKPLRGPWASFAVDLPNAVDWRGAPEILRRTFESVNGESTHSTHPGLRNRLARLGAGPGAPLPPAIAAPASQLLGLFNADVIRYFDQHWWRANQDRWHAFHAGVAGQRARLGALDAAAKLEGLGLETAIERASRAEYLIGPEAAIARYEWCLRRFPTQAAGYYHLGELLLSVYNEQGIGHLIHAMSLDETATPDATALITDYLNGSGQTQRAHAYIAKANVWMNGDRQRSDAAIELLAEQGRMTSWQLDRCALDSVRNTLGKLDTIRSAWLVQTPLRPWSPEERGYLILEPAHAKRITWQLHQARDAVVRTGYVGSTHILGLTEFSATAQNAIRSLDEIRAVLPDDGGPKSVKTCAVPGLDAGLQPSVESA